MNVLTSLDNWHALFCFHLYLLTTFSHAMLWVFVWWHSHHAFLKARSCCYLLVLRNGELSVYRFYILTTFNQTMAPCLFLREDLCHIMSTSMLPTRGRRTVCTGTGGWSLSSSAGLWWSPTSPSKSPLTSPTPPPMSPTSPTPPMTSRTLPTSPPSSQLLLPPRFNHCLSPFCSDSSCSWLSKIGI